MPTLIGRMPVELRSMVFSLMMFTHSGPLFSALPCDIHHFYWLRAWICSLSSEWCRFIWNEPAFWSFIFIERGTRLDPVLSSIRRSQGCLLCYRFNFTSIYVSSAQVEMDVAARVTFLKPYMTRAMEVLIVTDSASAFRACHTAFAFASAPELRSLTLNFLAAGHSSGWNIVPPPPPHPLDPSSWFQGRWTWQAGLDAPVRAVEAPLSNLHSLKLTAAVVVVPSYGFPSLVSLEINHVPSVNSFTFSALRTIFSTCPKLSSVTLFAVAIPEVLHIHPVPAIVAPALSDLHVMWSVDASVALFISSLIAPRLSYVQMLLTSARTVRHAVSCAGIFSSAQHLCIYDLGYSSFVVSPVYKAFRNITTLDIRRTMRVVFRDLVSLTLCDVNAHQSPLLPSLHTIFIPYDVFSLIRQFLCARLLLASLCTPVISVGMNSTSMELVSYGPITYSSYLDYVWLRATLDSFTLVDI